MSSAEVATVRPYFVTDPAIRESDVRAIIAGDFGEAERIKMTASIMQNARFDDIWQYISIDEIIDNWRLIRRSLWPPESRDLWDWALKVWGYDVPST